MAVQASRAGFRCRISRVLPTAASAEQFTDEERRRLAPYFTNLDSPHLRADEPAGDRQGRAVRPLLAVGEVAAATVSRRVPQRHLSRRRSRQSDCWNGASRAALRSGVQRVRRRLGRAAGRRAHRLRIRLERPDQGARARPPDGVPRAVHALRALHRQARTAAFAITCPRRSVTARCAIATPRRWMRRSRRTRG